MTLNAPAHKQILLQILKDIYSDNSISPFLAFKGGTCAYLFYELDRFSVDLDFDLLDPEKEDYVFESILKILRTYGEVKESAKKRFNLFYLLSYDNKKENAQNVKIEINRRNFGSKYELKSYLGVSMLVMTQDDMFANKLVAMYERIGQTNRDIFDVYFFFKNNWPMNKNLIEERTGVSYKEFLQKCLTAVEQFNDHYVLDGLGELLNEKQKMWVKTKLKSEVIFSLKLALQNEA
ncbi:MAG: nucleotidyl transferase AbiEii/AbiGii toxin family protein [Candidatus Gracilibacteria bacterium]